MIISLHEVKLLPLCLLQKCAIAHFFIDQIVAKRLLPYRIVIFYNRNIIHQKRQLFQMPFIDRLGCKNIQASAS